MYSFEVLDNVAGLGGDDDSEQILHGLIHISDILAFDIGSLAFNDQFGKCSDEAFDIATRDIGAVLSSDQHCAW